MLVLRTCVFQTSALFAPRRSSINQSINQSLHSPIHCCPVLWVRLLPLQFVGCSAPPLTHSVGAGPMKLDHLLSWDALTGLELDAIQGGCSRKWSASGGRPPSSETRLPVRAGGLVSGFARSAFRKPTGINNSISESWKIGKRSREERVPRAADVVLT